MTARYPFYPTTLLLLLVLTGCSKPPYTNIDNQQLQTLLEQGIPLYDIRRADEWRQTGIIAGSHTITFVDNAGRLNKDFLPRLARDVGKNDAVIFICKTGSRSSALAGYLMEKRGYTQVYNVRNGIAGWLRERRATRPPY